jgi:hypothetical protein
MDIEGLLKQHVDNVSDTLKGFEGKLGSQVDAIEALKAEAKAVAIKAARPPAGAGFESKGGSIPDDERNEMADFMTKGTPFTAIRRATAAIWSRSWSHPKSSSWC